MLPANPAAAGHQWRVRASILALLLAVGAPSCSSESGILISVTGEDVDSLEFHVGVLIGENYILSPESSGQQFDVRGRNLNASPYELFLREQEEGGDPATLWVLSLGRRGEEIRSLAVTEPAQTFIRDELLRRSLQLTRTNGETSARQLGRTCWRVRQGDSRWRIFTETDMDCDGSTTTVDEPDDCNDQDDAIYPGAAEVCDGKENNCDDQYAPGTQACYARVKEVCRTGTRICRDAQAQGLDPACMVAPEGKHMPEAYCREYEQCEGAAPLTCMENHLRRETMSCTINTKKEGELCFVKVSLPPPVSDSHHHGTCTWVLFETSGINLSFAEGTQQNTSTSCEPMLYLKKKGEAEVATVDVEFIYGEGEEQDSVLIHAELELTPAGDDGCPAEFSCS